MFVVRRGTVLGAAAFGFVLWLGAPGPAAASPAESGATGKVASSPAKRPGARAGTPYGRRPAVKRALLNQAPSLSAQGPGHRLPNGQIWDYVHGWDPEGDAIRYTLDRAPQHGTVAVSADGHYTYTPGAGFTGVDTFVLGAGEARFHLNLRDPFGNRTSQVAVTVRSDPGNVVVVDDFDGAAGARPYPGLWNYELGIGVGDGLQTYTDSTANVRLDGQGHLVVQASPAQGGYTSGFLDTKGKLDMAYGTLTARIKLPAGQGIWPAFWMLGSTFSRDTWNAPDQRGWPGCGEIDVMELAGTAETYHVALHGPQGAFDYYKGTSTPWQVVGHSGPAAEVSPVADLSADYHDYWVTRAPELVVIGIDDHVVGEFTPASLPAGARWVFDGPMFALLNVAVGGPWPGPPDATTPWPATMLVDWFRYDPSERHSPS